MFYGIWDIDGNMYTVLDVYFCEYVVVFNVAVFMCSREALYTLWQQMSSQRP